jgi:hypothetical protein
MIGRYRQLRNAADNAARIGATGAAQAFAIKASLEKWVEPQDWNPGTCWDGIPLRGADLGNTATWQRKADAQAAARAIGWPVGEVTKVRNPIHGDRWALVDGRFGLLSRHAYDAALRDRACGVAP